MIRCAVIGNPISHSLSPLIHQHFAEQAGLPLTYERIQGDNASFEDQIVRFFKEGNRGLNVTLPYKLRAFTMADYVSPRCQQAKAANTLWMEKGKLHADNTDGAGLITDLSRSIDVKNKKIIVLGAGGAARGILGPLLEASPASLIVVNRTFETAMTLWQDFPRISAVALTMPDEPYDLLINATSAGCINEALQWPALLLEKKPFCYDLSYGRDRDTDFVAQARAIGCDAVDGLGMLVEQAALAFFQWHHYLPETARVVDMLRVKKL